MKNFEFLPEAEQLPYIVLAKNNLAEILKVNPGCDIANRAFLIHSAAKRIYEFVQSQKPVKCSIVEIDSDVLEICIDMYNSGDKLTAIQWLTEEAKKVSNSINVGWAKRYLESIGLESISK